MSDSPSTSANRRGRLLPVLLGILVASWLAAPVVAGKARPIVPDGEFGDWAKVGKPLVDPIGDFVLVATLRRDTRTETKGRRQ